MALARHRSPHGAGVSVGVWTAEGLCLLEAARAAGALWHHEVFHRRMGGLRAAYRCRAASRGEGEHPENREQAHQSPDPHQAVSASYAVLFHIRRDLSSNGLLTIVCKRLLIRKLEERFESQSRASRSGIALGVSPLGVSSQVEDHRLEGATIPWPIAIAQGAKQLRQVIGGGHRCLTG